MSSVVCVLKWSLARIGYLAFSAPGREKSTGEFFRVLLDWVQDKFEEIGECSVVPGFETG